MKKNYKLIMAQQIAKLPVFQTISLEYTLYPRTKLLCDLSNVCSIVDKFFSDALVESGKIEDDNYIYIPRVVFTFGSISKDNPRCEILIKEIT